MTSTAPPGGFEVHVTPEGHTTVVAVAGEIDLYTGPPLWDQLDHVISTGVADVVIDLGAVDFIDSSGISVLVKAMMRLRDRGGDLRLRSVTPRTYRVLEVTGLTRVISVDLRPAAAQGAAASSSSS